jgi:hypothetical protein
MVLDSDWIQQEVKMKPDIIEKKLEDTKTRKKERVALWSKVQAALEDGGLTELEGLLESMATSMEERRLRISDRISKEVGISDGDNQES